MLYMLRVKENRTSFIIVRVTEMEKDYLKKMAIKAKKRFSAFIRKTLGLE